MSRAGKGVGEAGVNAAIARLANRPLVLTLTVDVIASRIALGGLIRSGGAHVAAAPPAVTELIGL